MASLGESLELEGGGLSNSPAIVEWARTSVLGLEITALGAARHHAPEDAPRDIGEAIDGWLDRLAH